MNNPIEYNGFKIESRLECKYLGQIIRNSLSESSMATVKVRENKIKGASIEVKSIIEDFCMMNYSGLEAAYII